MKSSNTLNHRASTKPSSGLVSNSLAANCSASFFQSVAQSVPHSATHLPPRLRSVVNADLRATRAAMCVANSPTSPTRYNFSDYQPSEANAANEVDEADGSNDCDDDDHSPKQNHLLSALSSQEFDRLLPYLELVEMPLGDVLYESGGRLQYVFFPTTSIVSLFYVLEDGASTEIAVVGNEGILGISTFMGGDTTPSRAVVQSAGFGYRLKVQLLKQEFECGGPLFRLLLRYTQALMTQMTQMAVCNRHHSLEQQLCRRLLFSLDRLPTDSLAMTQELIANMLGVRREGVTAAAGNLQRAGLIRYSRGRIEVLNRRGLEAAVCECYGVVKLEFERLLSDTQPTYKSDPFHALREPELRADEAPNLRFSRTPMNLAASRKTFASNVAGGE